MSTGQLRSIAIAAREAMIGKDESLWQACWQNVRERSIHMSEEQMIEEIKSWSPEERALYGVSDE